MIRPNIELVRLAFSSPFFEIQANRGRSWCVEWSVRQNTGGKYFIGPKTTPPDQALTSNLLNSLAEGDLMRPIIELVSLGSSSPFLRFKQIEDVQGV